MYLTGLYQKPRIKQNLKNVIPARPGASTTGMSESPALYINQRFCKSLEIPVSAKKTAEPE